MIEKVTPPSLPERCQSVMRLATFKYALINVDNKVTLLCDFQKTSRRQRPNRMSPTD
ncbi:hypothetical protein OK016_21725 [Vibrio chagasii]|nr:hypothetical protein [Vibrio chagasii]